MTISLNAAWKFDLFTFERFCYFIISLRIIWFLVWRYEKYPLTRVYTEVVGFLDLTVHGSWPKDHLDNKYLLHLMIIGWRKCSVCLLDWFTLCSTYRMGQLGFVKVLDVLRSFNFAAYLITSLSYFNIDSGHKSRKLVIACKVDFEKHMTWTGAFQIQWVSIVDWKGKNFSSNELGIALHLLGKPLLADI